LDTHTKALCEASGIRKLDWYSLHVYTLSFEAVCIWVGRERNRAELISLSTTFGIHMKVFPNGLFEQEIGSALSFLPGQLKRERLFK
jgi:hypothetical protein